MSDTKLGLEATNKLLASIDKIVNENDLELARFILRQANVGETPEMDGAIKTYPIDSDMPPLFYLGYLKGMEGALLAGKLRDQADGFIVLAFFRVLQLLIQASEKIQ